MSFLPLCVSVGNATLLVCVVTISGRRKGKIEEGRIREGGIGEEKIGDEGFEGIIICLV
jgi:hypothetical protein